MSQRDLNEDEGTLIGFKGRRCFATLHTNSIRFRFDDQEKQGHYIWVDPPWVLLSGSEEITNSQSYSENRFEEWCRLFSAVRETTLQDFETGKDGEVTLVFANGLKNNPLDPDSDNRDLDYDHWYAYDL